MGNIAGRKIKIKPKNNSRPDRKSKKPSLYKKPGKKLRASRPRLW